jgi:hypothetical protein
LKHRQITSTNVKPFLSRIHRSVGFSQRKFVSLLTKDVLDLATKINKGVTRDAKENIAMTK